MSEIEQLKDEIKVLKSTVALLIERLEKNSMNIARLASGVTELADEQIRTYERIKNIELSAFPKISADIRKAQTIIGTNVDDSDNPLDRRPS